MIEQLRLSNTIVELKKKIISKKGYSSHELNDEILSEMKREFENLNGVDIEECKSVYIAVSLNRTQEKFFDKLKEMYGISFTQLYIRSTIKIAQQQKII